MSKVKNKINNSQVKLQYRIGDEVVLSTKNATDEKEVLDIVYSSSENQWYYIFDMGRLGEYPFTVSKIHRYSYFQKEACPNCLAEGQRERSRLRCLNDDCDTRLFSGLTVDLGTYTVTAPSVHPDLNVFDEDELEDIKYSVKKSEWLYDFFDEENKPVTEYS